MITVVHGPEASGKTRNAEALKEYYKCKRIIEEYPLGDKLEDGDLLLVSNVKNLEFDEVTIPIQFIPIQYALKRIKMSAKRKR